MLNIFLAASAVRNILNRPKPRKEEKITFIPDKHLIDPRQIPAFHPNHVWSIDLSAVNRWMLFPTHILVAIDHYSRKN